MELAKEMVDKVYNGGPIRVSCDGCNTSDWTVAKAASGGCASKMDITADKATKVCGEKKSWMRFYPKVV